MSATPYVNPLAGLSASEKAALRKVVATALNARPIPAAELPRFQVGPDVSGLNNERAQSQRDIADAHGLTADIESMFADGKSAKEVTAALGDRLDFMAPEDRPALAVDVRATLGIPSRFDEHGIAEFEKWRQARADRIAGVDPDAAELTEFLKANPFAAKPIEEIQALHRRAEQGDAVAALLMRGVKAELEEEEAEREEFAESLAKAVNEEERQADNEVKPEGPVLPSFNPRAIPASVDEQFGRRGNRFTDPYNSRKTLWVDHGTSLQTPKSFDPKAIRAMVETANERGWTSIRVRGDETFRRAVWFEAASRGMEVAGYQPTTAEKLAAERAAAKNPSINTLQENDLVRAYRGAKDDQARMAASKTHPSLKNSFALEVALQKFADKMLSPADRDRFMERQRENIAKDLSAGVAHGTIKIRDQRQQQRTHNREVEA